MRTPKTTTNAPATITVTVTTPPPPLPGYDALRTMLDALAKRAAVAAGVPETGVCNPLRRDEYEAMALRERVALCRAAQQAYDSTTCLIPNPAYFDSLHIGGGRYWVWFYTMRQIASERGGVAKMEVLRGVDERGVSTVSVRTVVLFDDASLTKVTLPAHRDAFLAMHWFSHLYPAVEVIAPQVFDRAYDVRVELAQAQAGKVSA